MYLLIHDLLYNHIYKKYIFKINKKMGCATTKVSDEKRKRSYEDSRNNKDDDSGMPERIPGQKPNFKNEDEPVSEMDGEYEEVN